MSVARPLMETRRGMRGEEGGGRRETGSAAWVATRMAAVEERYGEVWILSDSLSMQITTITGNAWALAPANCHGNNKEGGAWGGFL